MSVENDNQSPGQRLAPNHRKKITRRLRGGYKTIVFTHETTQGPKTYLEWEGKALGGLATAGVTVLTKNAAGKIESVRLMHRPLTMVLARSANWRGGWRGNSTRNSSILGSNGFGPAMV